MITPNFKIEQNDEFIIISIRLKYVKISDVEFFIENNNFKFYLKPYYLNLFFSDNLIESDKNSSKYDLDNGILTVNIEKEIHGTTFKDLELLSNLLNNQNNNSNVNIKVEEIEESYYNKFEDVDEDTLNNLLFSDMTKEKSEILLESDDYNYGFNNKYNDVFKNRTEELLEIADINPDEIKIKYRYIHKMKRENEDFIAERYIFDEYEEEEIKRIEELKIEKFLKKNELDSIYSQKEHSCLMSISKIKLCLFPEEIYFEFYLEVIDIIFSFLYDIRINDLESNSESGWNINKISSVLSSFLSYKGLFYTNSDIPPLDYIKESLSHLLINSYRRILCYPLYRNFNLCERVKKDIIYFISKGKALILKLLLNVKIIFEKSEPRHILNKIYLDYYCKWVQKSSDKIWEIILKNIKSIKINKNDLKLNLLEIEQEYI